jgi:hypothetical protein
VGGVRGVLMVERCGEGGAGAVAGVGAVQWKSSLVVSVFNFSRSTAIYHSGV